ncbi:MAG: matrixin family metalloprotease, partial [Rhodothermales bacterium]|nr:matrixin family metalloprotease [Rhodothermales bacterium]
MRSNSFARLSIILALMASPAAAQTSMLYEVPLQERIDEADLVFEGRVQAQESFWNEDRTLIFTSSAVDVYRLFKGRVVAERVEVVTPGGRVGLIAQLVEPSLHLQPGDVGLFLVAGADEHGGLGKSNVSGRFVPVASVQGMVRYDEIRGIANDVFTTYGDIERDLHAAVAEHTGAPAVLTHYDVPVPAGRRVAKTGLVPSIASISPGTLTAGTNTVLTISGSGFEAYDGGTNSRVFFPNADDGGSSLINAPAGLVSMWTDTEIQVRVPTRAGTGTVTVQTASAQQATSSTSLTIDYNLIGLPFSGDLWRTSLAAKSAGGGYSMRMSTSTSDGGASFAGSPAVAPFERALLTWQQITGLNIQADGADIDSSRIAPNSDNDIITFENDATPLPSGVLGRAFSGFISCDGQTWIVQGIDLQFRRDGNSVTWNWGPDANSGNRADFESVALHELGHAHQLGHIIAPGKVMHYALTNGTDVRVLNADSDIAGGNDALDFVQRLNTFCGGRMWTGMQRLVGVGVEDDVARGGYELSGPYPNPASQNASFTVRVDRNESVR